MSGSQFGTLFTVTTWGESHGAALGAVVDGVPAGIPLEEEVIQKFLDRRKPGQNQFTTKRQESDQVEILSGIFQGKTTGTPISLMVRNEDQRSKDYSQIQDIYRPGHADYTFDRKYGIRDYRGGGRSSGRETIGRVAAGAIASCALGELGITVEACTDAIGPVHADASRYDKTVINKNPFYLPDEEAAREAEVYVKQLMEEKKSAGGVVRCVIHGLPAGVGEPVFEKLSANLAKAVMSIGAVKGFEIGAGFGVAESTAPDNNDEFYQEQGIIRKRTNHSGGILGGISDGSDVIFRAAFKPTPSVASLQHTVTTHGENTDISIHGRHDPLVVPRAVVVVESMAAICTLDLLLRGMSSRMDRIKEFYDAD